MVTEEAEERKKMFICFYYTLFLNKNPTPFPKRTIPNQNKNPTPSLNILNLQQKNREEDNWQS